jgi:hypothetical protein
MGPAPGVGPAAGARHTKLLLETKRERASVEVGSYQLSCTGYSQLPKTKGVKSITI